VKKAVKTPSVLVGGILVSAYFFERGYSSMWNMVWRSVNRGKLWPDVKKQLKL